MLLLTQKEKKHKKQKFCHICKDDSNNQNYQKICDHCHYTGKYKDTAHGIFELRYKTPNEIPVMFLVLIMTTIS